MHSVFEKQQTNVSGNSWQFIKRERWIMAQEINSKGAVFAGTNPSLLERYRRREQVVEVVAIICLVCSLGVIWFNPSPLWLWLGLLMGLTGLACAYAIRYSYMADQCSYAAQEAQRASSEEAIYKVTTRRLRLLTEKGIEQDILDVIKDLERGKPMKAGEILGRLESELGQERTDEVSAIVLKYLRINKDLSDNSPPEK